ncbi:hypothetical protein Cni_G09104 [Canna indica]|uniref:Uncharacterized protein n=1 Tax=Canna indica TaxID=4628 RepID=A0AAQ3Q8I5_9LILI|nr:hypothetical protein Cni_G09104 [Canna indica]
MTAGNQLLPEHQDMRKEHTRKAKGEDRSWHKGERDIYILRIMLERRKYSIDILDDAVGVVGTFILGEV